MECSKYRIIHSKSCDRNDKIPIKEEPLHFNEISTELQESPVPHTETCFEMVPEKSELITCDTVADIKQEPWQLNDVPSYIKSELQEPTISDLEPYMKTVVIKMEDHFKTDVKEETLWPNESSTQVRENSEHSESLHGGKGSELYKIEACNEIRPLELPRLTAAAIYLDGNSATLLDVEKNGATHKMVYEMNVNQETTMTQNICLLNSNQKCDGDHFKSERNVGDKRMEMYQCKIGEKNQNIIHLGSSTYKCVYCEKSFTRKSVLQRHTLLHSDMKPYKCDYCQKSFITKSYLKRHTMLHSSTTPYKCEICKKCFTQKQHLQKHTLLHSGTKPYKCDICERCFTQKSTLQTHTLIHSGSKPYKCDICQKCFTQSSALKAHTLIHLGTKQYKCDLCEKCFARKSVLQRHSLLHSGTKPHKCDECQKCFTRKSALQRHTLFHSGIKPYRPYKCDVCKRCFTRKSHLQRHTTLVH